MDNAILERNGLKAVELVAESSRIEIWKMIQPAINRSVLVHVFKPVLADDATTSAWMFSVIRAVSNVNSPAFANIYTIIDNAELKAVITEYVEGLSLDTTVSALGPLSVKQVIRIGSALAESLAALWNSAHIIHGGIKAELITLDAGSTAKLISPCFAHPAAADQPLPVSDMSDLGGLLYFLSTGVKPGDATSIVIPQDFRHIIERLTTENVVQKYTSWENVLIDLNNAECKEQPEPSAASRVPRLATKRLVKLATVAKSAPSTPPASAAPAAPRRGKLSIKRAEPEAAANASTTPEIKPAQNAPAAKVATTHGSATIAGRNSLEAVRADAARIAAEEESTASGGPLHFLLWVLLIIALVILFVYRVASSDPEFMPDNTGSKISVAPHGAVLVAPAEPAEPEEKTEKAEEPSENSDDLAMNRYFAAHVGEQIPFLYKGEQRAVTLISYDAENIVIKTKKTLTLPRASISDEQRALWK